MALPSFIEERAGAVCLHLRVQPRASRSGLAGAAGDALKVRVTAPPVDSAANAAVLELLADALKVPRGAVRLIRGASSRSKLVVVAGLPAAEVAARLAAAMSRE